jgi:8-oxo-dGTP diphosphatase
MKNNDLLKTLRPLVTVDGILLTDKRVLLIRRRKKPFKGMWAIPGGFVEYGEEVEKAVLREFEEETGLKANVIELLGVYSNPKRDPRMHTISIVFLLKADGTPIAGDDAIEVKFFEIDRLPALAFDHKMILDNALKKLSDNDFLV